MEPRLITTFWRYALVPLLLLLLASCGTQKLPETIEIAGPDAYLLTEEGETVELRANVTFTDGSVVQDAQVSWSASDPSVLVDEDGIVSAASEAAHAQVFASIGQITSRPVEVAAVRVAEGTTVIKADVVSSAEVVSEITTRATIAVTPETAALEVGDVVVSRDGLYGRIVAIAVAGDELTVETELVPLSQAFTKIMIDASGEPQSLRVTVTPTEVRIADPGNSLAPLEVLPVRDRLKCETDGTLARLNLTGGSIDIDVDVRVVARYAYDKEADIDEFFLFAQGTPSISVTALTLSGDFGPKATAKCFVELKEFSLPVATFWGLLSVTGDVQPSVGFRIGASAELGSLELTGPFIDNARSTVRAGVRHSAQAGWTGIGDGGEPITVQTTVADLGWGSFAAQAGWPAFKFTMGPYLELTTGAGFRIGFFEAVGVNFLSASVALLGSIDVPSVVIDDIDYQGPSLDLALHAGANAFVKLDGGLKRALDLFGIKAGITLASVDRRVGTVFTSQPPEFSADTVSVGDAGGVTFSIRDPLRREGSKTSVRAFAPDGTSFLIGEAETTGDGVATITWYPEVRHNGSYRVKALMQTGLPFPVAATELLPLNVSVTPGTGDAPVISYPTPNPLVLRIEGSADELEILTMTGTFSFANLGGKDLSYELGWKTSKPAWAAILSATEGSLGQRQLARVDIQASCASVGAGTHAAAVAIASNAPSSPVREADVVLECVETGGPVIIISSPADGETVSSNVLVQGTVEHDAPILELAYRVNDGLRVDVTPALSGNAFSFSIGSQELSGGTEPTANTISVTAVDDSGFEGVTSVTVAFDAFVPPAAGRDIVVFNDINLFDDRFGGPDPQNQQLIRNLVGFTGSGEREDGTVVLFDRGRNSLCANTLDCRDTELTQMLQTIRDQGYVVQELGSTQGSITNIPQNVKVLFLWNPQVAYTVDEINTLKRFAGEGGRLVFVGEHEGYYGANLALQNQFLTNIGAVMRNTGDALDCGLTFLPGTSLRPHQITEGVSSLTVACASVVELGPNDFPLFYDTTNTRVLAGVAAVDVTPIDKLLPASELHRSQNGVQPGADPANRD